MSFLAAASTIEGDTAVSIVVVTSIVLGSLAVRKWISDVKDAAKDARHELELRIQALETRATASGAYEAPK